jgi:hypothetical protein
MLTLRKAEISIEFIVFIGILLVFSVFFIGIIGANTRDINESTLFTDAQKISDNIANEINTATRMIGYYREFYLPEKLVNGQNYSVEINTNFRLVIVKWNNKNVMSNIETEKVTGNVEPGKNNRIKNEGGLIIIES